MIHRCSHCDSCNFRNELVGHPPPSTASSPSYVSFTGTPIGPYGQTALVAESFVQSGESDLSLPLAQSLIAEAVSDVLHDDGASDTLPVADWIDIPFFQEAKVGLGHSSS